MKTRSTNLPPAVKSAWGVGTIWLSFWPMLINLTFNKNKAKISDCSVHWSAFLTNSIAIIANIHVSTIRRFSHELPSPNDLCRAFRCTFMINNNYYVPVQLTAIHDLVPGIPRDSDAMSKKSCSALQVPCAAL